LRLHQGSLAEWPHQPPSRKLCIDHRRSAQGDADAVHCGGQSRGEMGKTKPAWPGVIGTAEVR
jgi:hypothetical protein